MKRVHLTINGLKKEFVVARDRRLLELLREDLRLTGAKQSCDRKGQCGACTVIVDGKATRSCLARVATLDGAEIITVEGLGTPENPHFVQEAFVLAGAIQCGFCTPGMIMTAKALLDRNPTPGEADIREAFKRQLCRCTGYRKIVEAVHLAGAFLRAERRPEDLKPDLSRGLIGVSMIRPSAYAKACGSAQFTADIPLQEAVEIAVVRSPHNSALIEGIDFAAALKMPGVLGVMTARDIAGTNRVRAVVPDQPVLCRRRIRVMGDPVAVVAAQSTALALAAAEKVRVQYKPLPEVKDPFAAMQPGAPIVHDDRVDTNVFLDQPLKRGDVDRAFAEADVVVEADFETQIVHQAPLEPEHCIAFFEDEDQDEPKLVVTGRSINIHPHADQLQEALGYDNLVVREAFSGGQFGIKLTITSEALTAAAALHFKRPVRYLPSLKESMQMTPKRHPFHMKTALAARRDGTLLGLKWDAVVENGAYTFYGSTVCNRALWMLTGAYHIPNLAARVRLVYTNNIWGSAARGAGPPQANFALESLIGMLAEKLGLDPLEIRRKNSLKVGQPLSTGKIVDEWFNDGCLDALAPFYRKALQEAATAGRGGRIRRGVGIGAAAFGIGSINDISNAEVELMPDDGVTVYGSMADPGEGTDTMVVQLAATFMGVAPDKVRLCLRDSELTPFSGSAAGSRQTFMSGGAVELACQKLKAAMAAAGARTAAELAAAGKPLRYLGTKQLPKSAPLDPTTGQGGNFDTWVHGVQMAEVAVDTQSGEVTVLRMTAVEDPGTIVNPQAVEGQIEGGVDMGIGMALREIYEHGKTTDWKTFKFPTIRTMPEIRIKTLETPRKRGPLGAAGVGEFQMVATLPAVTAAIHNACGRWITALPATPERVLAALKE